MLFRTVLLESALYFCHQYINLSQTSQRLEIKKIFYPFWMVAEFKCFDVKYSGMRNISLRYLGIY